MRTVVILDQHAGFTPHHFDQHPTSFSALIAAVRETGQKFEGFVRPEVREVEDDFKPWFGTMAIAADEFGRCFVWKSRVDSSG